MASSSSSTPAAVSAPISPSEWPAAIAGSASDLCQPAIEAQKIAGWAKRVDSSTRANGILADELDAAIEQIGELPRDVIAHVGGLGALAGKQQGNVGSRGHERSPCPL